MRVFVCFIVYMFKMFVAIFLFLISNCYNVLGQDFVVKGQDFVVKGQDFVVKGQDFGVFSVEC